MNEDLAKARTDEEGRTIRSRSARMLSAFSSKHRRIESLAVRDPDPGEVYSDPGWVGHLLAHHWGLVFAKAPSPSRTSMRPFLDVCPRLSEDEVFEPLPLTSFRRSFGTTRPPPPGRTVSPMRCGCSVVASGLG